jgi:hypothetical protein
MRRAVFLLSLSFLLAACGRAPDNSTPVAVTQAPPQAATGQEATASAVAGTSEAAEEATSVPPAVTDEGPEVAADVALAQGSVTDTGPDGTSRTLKDGDSVYAGDSFSLGADSYLDLDFTDGGHILLRPNTTFKIDRFHFEPEAHPGDDGTPATLIKPAEPENAFFSLIKGGLRAIDGVIGHTEPESYGVQTPVATIGVRGTAFDVRYCGDDCQDEADSSGKPENGLYTSVDDGSIGVKTDAGETVTPKGHSGFVKSRRERLRALNTPPKALRHMRLPDKLKARDDDNHKKMNARQKQRRQLRIERHKKRAEWEKKHPAAAAKLKAQKAAAEPEQKPAPHVGQRFQPQKQAPAKQAPQAKAGNDKPRPKAAAQDKERQQKLKQRFQPQAKERPAAKSGPAAAPKAVAEPRGGKLKDMKPQKPAASAAKAQPEKKDKPAKAKDDCKDKKDKKKAKGKDRDKDKCGG